jgi:uncharacterized protein YjbI with pentapeptide repeats
MTPGELRAALAIPWAHGEHFAATGETVSDPANLDGLTLRSFDLSGAEFMAGLSARKSTFRGMSWLKGARVSGVLNLSGAVLRNDLRLDGLICDRLILTGARAQGVIDLDGAQIGALHLDDCVCLANVSLGGVQISGTLDLSGSDLMGGIWARGSQIGAVSTEGLLIEGRAVDF